MPTPLPRPAVGSSPLAKSFNQLRQYVLEQTLRSTPQYSIDQHASGQFLRLNIKSEGGGGGTVSFRGRWTDGQQYKEGDIVHYRNLPNTGAPEVQGTFWCVRDHLATPENRPTEQLPEQVDPVSGDEWDLWRTLASGAFEQFVVKAFDLKTFLPGGEPGPVIPQTSRTVINSGDLICIDGDGTLAAGATGETYVNGINAGEGSFEINCKDLPAGMIAKFRLVTMCIGEEKHTAYVLMTIPVPVP